MEDAPPLKRRISTTTQGSSSSTPPPPAKRHRTGRGKKKTHNVVLPTDVYSIILSMLHPKEQYRLAFTSKANLRLVTHEMVIYSSIQHGGWAEKTCRSVLQLVQQRLIYIPSPLRLLRLVNGKRCEAMDCQRHVHYAKSSTMGAFLCSSCVEARTIPAATLRGGHGRSQLPRILRHDRVARTTQSGESGLSLWKEHHGTVGGETYGPIIVSTDVQLMLETNQTVDEFWKQSPSLPPHEHYDELRNVLLKVWEIAVHRKGFSSLEFELVTKQNLRRLGHRHDLDAESLHSVLQAMTQYFRHRHAEQSVSPTVLLQQLDEMKKDVNYRQQRSLYADFLRGKV